MVFDFAMLDDLLDVPPDSLAATLSAAQITGGNELGPAVEYAYIRRQSESSHLPQVTSLVSTEQSCSIENCLNDGGALGGSSISPLTFEVASFPASISENPHWTAFLWRLANAAKEAGADDAMAKGFGGAYSELANNVVDHSTRSDTAVLGYRWAPGIFEMVIADAGIGVRASLAQNPTYASIDDDCLALEQATTMGASRFPDGSGHGTGFKTVFDSIAGLKGYLRFRSGDAAMILDGIHGGQVRRKSCQRKHFCGMFAAITCVLS